MPLLLVPWAVAFGHQATEVPRLIGQLGSPVFAEREAASKRLAEIGAPAEESLRKAARENPDAEIRWRAEHLLSGLHGRAGFPKDRPLAGWSRMLADKDSRVRKQAAQALVRLGAQAKAEIPSLRRALGDPDAGVRWRAGLALWRADHGLAREALDAMKQAGSEMEKRLLTLTTDADVKETEAMVFAALEVVEGRPQRMDR
jgi:HEAT repeat protein